jgi:hypothetical protein
MPAGDDRRLEGSHEVEIAQDIAVHRRGALVVRVDVLECTLDPPDRIVDRPPWLGVWPRVGGKEVRRACIEQLPVGREVAVDVWRCTPARSATALNVVLAGPSVPCSSTAASVIRKRVAAISVARCLSSYLRLGLVSLDISV